MTTGRIGGSTNVLAMYDYTHGLPSFKECAVKTRKSVCPPIIELPKKDEAPTFDEIWEEDMVEANSLDEDPGVYWRGIRQAKIFKPN